MEEKKQEGLIPKIIKKYLFSKRFTKEEREELNKIEKEAYMAHARIAAKDTGKQLAETDFKDKLTEVK